MDRELLEWAAKAAGYENVGFSDAGECCIGYISPNRYDFVWLPLVDDGDALRLSCDCFIDMHFGMGFVTAEGPQGNATELFQRDDIVGRREATRRAIVRAAAEIGKRIG